MEQFLAPYKRFFLTGHWWCPHRPHETLPFKLPIVEKDKCEFDTYRTIQWVTPASALTSGPLTSSPMTSGALTDGSLTSRALKVGEVASLKRRRWGRRKAQVEEEKVEEDTVSSTALPELEEGEEDTISSTSLPELVAAHYQVMHCTEDEEEEEHCAEDEERFEKNIKKSLLKKNIFFSKCFKTNAF